MSRSVYLMLFCWVGLVSLSEAAEATNLVLSGSASTNLEVLSAEEHKARGLALFAALKNEEAEKEFQAAAQLKPDDADTFGHWGYTLLLLNRLEPALKALRTALELEPYAINAAWLHTKVAFIYLHQGNRARAIDELNVAARMAAPEDISTEGELWAGFSELREVASAVEHGEKFIALAQKYGVETEKAKAVTQSLQELRPLLTSHYFTNTPPKDLLGKAYSAALRKKLTKPELKLVINPLESTPEIDAWARQLVNGATNDLQKASLLFKAMLRRAGEGEYGFPDHHNTAREVFAEWNNPQAQIHCQQTTFLYVALARAVGLKAYVVEVTESCDGGKHMHGCAAVFFGHRGLLIDPAYVWFGVPHRRFTVLSDLHATAVYLCDAGSLQDARLNEIAAKLAPEMAFVQANLLIKRMNLGKWDEARKHLPDLLKVDTVGALGCSCQARLALHDQKFDDAVRLLTKAIGIDPLNANYRLLLGDAYASQGKIDEARKAYRAVLTCPHSEKQAADAAEALAKIDEAVRGVKTGVKNF